MSAPLPIFELRQTFTAALLDPATPNLLIKAPTGSGKSTQIPQFVLDSGVLAEGKRCIVLQPRRIAARMLAQRIMGEAATPEERFTRAMRHVGSRRPDATELGILPAGMKRRQDP